MFPKMEIVKINSRNDYLRAWKSKAPNCKLKGASLLTLHIPISKELFRPGTEQLKKKKNSLPKERNIKCFFFKEKKKTRELYFENSSFSRMIWNTKDNVRSASSLHCV